jgi:hypothetical protein
MGDTVDMRGHPHPPLNAWFLGLLLAIFKDVYEVPYHTAYILFSVVAPAAMWSLARRFSPHPLWASLLFIAVPTFVVNGNSFESDIPFLAFWMAAIALYVAAVDRRGKWLYAAAALCLALASLTAFQALFAIPVLAVYPWLYSRRDRLAWAVLFTPAVVIGGWQLFERFSTGTLPAAVLGGYFQTYGLQALKRKWMNAAALAIHSLWIVFPALLPPAIALSWRRRDRDTMFLASWIGLFFACALVVFFAGSARYLLPMAAPVVLLVSRMRPRWLALGFAAQLAIGLCLATVNYEHWDGYRRFAASLRDQMSGRRVWVNGEWGLRHYFEAEGALPLQRGQRVSPGDMVVSSRLAFPVEFNSGGGVLVSVAEREIRPRLPFRLIGLDTGSAYSTVSEGFSPFGVTNAPADIVRADIVVERQPTLERLAMNALEAPQHIVSGMYNLEGDRWRWTAATSVFLLKPPTEPAKVAAAFVIPPAAPARRISLLLDGEKIASRVFPGPGAYTLESGLVSPPARRATVTLEVDKTFSVPGDNRVLGIILTEIGFR